jgi:membrane-associated phospholipid phosphatase
VSGLDVLHAIQSIHTPFLDRFFALVTDLHNETVYVLVLPLIYWLYDKRFGRYLFAVFALGYWTNDTLKLIFATTRPDPSQVRVLHPESTQGKSGFPSGHSQTPLVFWGALAWEFRRWWTTAIAVALIFLIGFSRLYLGLHWPLDILGGWAIGLVVLGLAQGSQGFWMGQNQSLRTRLILALAVPALALAITWLAGGAVDGLTLTVMGVFAGLMAGSAIEEVCIGFEPRRGSVAVQALKVVVGLALLFGVKEGFKLFLPHTAVGDLIRYFAMAVAATLGAPWIFHRFLATRPAATDITGVS